MVSYKLEFQSQLGFLFGRYHEATTIVYDIKADTDEKAIEKAKTFIKAENNKYKHWKITLVKTESIETNILETTSEKFREERLLEKEARDKQDRYNLYVKLKDEFEEKRV